MRTIVIVGPVMHHGNGRDGARLAWHEAGTGRPLVLLHGLLGDSALWTRSGHAQALAAQGYRVIMPDLRGHGGSARSHDAAAYPPDVLTDDGLALVEQLGLDDYDLGGYSLGARIAFRMAVRGAAPRRIVVGGQGLRELLGTGGGAGNLLRRVFAGGPFAPGSAEERTERWLRTNGEDPVALGLVLDSIVDTPLADIERVTIPALVVMGADDERAPSADELAVALPGAVRATVPGDHGAAATAPELAAAIIRFLGGAPL
ncbi:alpha/beta fold hydrolase [Dactylosporangium sp. CS-033363]|uniref:alpha/beta fold hydrolase n=1 Tax=Dactylosporangium sp. CS-033363 TaxID=3239935 RepID=UPI003D9191EB